MSKLSISNFVGEIMGGAPTLDLCIHVRGPPNKWGGGVIDLPSLNILHPISS